MSIELSDLGELGEAIKAEIARAAKESVSELLSEAGEPSEKAKQIKHRIEEILAKEFITTQEAAYLLSCSDAHIRNMVNETESGKSKHPIPFTRLGSKIIVLHTKSLLEWALKKKEYESPKTKQT